MDEAIRQQVPSEERSRPTVREVVAEIRRFRKTRPLGDLSVRDLKEVINEGRRL